MKQAWIERPEGGTTFGYKLISGFAKSCGRTAARLALYPITLYFLIRRGPERRASRDYLRRVLGRRTTLWDVAQHIFCFAAVTLDRVFLLSERFKRFDIQVFGLEEVRKASSQQRGVLIFGSHLGSFEALRALAHSRPDVIVRPVIDIEQNPALSKILASFNPALASTIINARQDGTTTALAIKEALDDKALVTLLVDRARPGNRITVADFLGLPAPFPTGPWQLAAALQVPVLLCFGLYRGGNRYELYFEPFADPLRIERANRSAGIEAAARRFAERLTHYTRSAPYNWFNFYDFWQLHEPHDSDRADAGAGTGRPRRRA
jgi:predicted LPLAT superfamily acyltransferase